MKGQRRQEQLEQWAFIALLLAALILGIITGALSCTA